MKGELQYMKKLFIFLSVFAFSAALSSQVALASGDKVRGENGEGDTVQECLNFDGCPYGDESPAK